MNSLLPLVPILAFISVCIADPHGALHSADRQYGSGGGGGRRIGKFGHDFFKVPINGLRNAYSYAGNGVQFHGFRQFNERPRPFKKHDLHQRFPHRCRSWPPKTRTFDGFCNNRRNPALGSAATPFKLIVPTGDTPEPTNDDRPNARVISNTLSNDNSGKGNHRKLSELVTFFGQLIDHTITETENDKVPFPIPVPANDSTFNGGVIPFFRTRKEKTARGYSPINLLPSFIDAASIYGPTEKRARKLRTFKGGHLRVGPGNVLPKDNRGFFLSGDKRANENPGLTAMHTLFFREHNRLADELSAAFPKWGDEKLYHIARKIVGAEMQAIVYYEFLPAVLGDCLPRYRGYRRNVDPRISNEFSTVAYRVGHTLINDDITARAANGSITLTPLRKAFFAPAKFLELGVDSLLRGMVATQAAEVDIKISGEVRNFLLGGPGSSLRLDLVALNIQRGRDHAVPDYNTMRKAYGLFPARSFKEITSNAELAAKLKRLFVSVDNMDAWVGGLSEDHAKGSSLGPLFRQAWIDEFTRLRDGDRFFFRRWRLFPKKLRRRVKTVRRLTKWKHNGGVMRRIILDNTDVNPKDIKWNPFKV